MNVGRFRVPNTLLVIGASLGLLGCGEEVDHLLAEGCEHMEEGPEVAVTAGLDALSAPDVSAGHTRFDITLQSVDGGMGGSVSYASGEEGDYVFYLSQDVSLTVADTNGVEVPLEASENPGEVCTFIVTYHTVELGLGTYTLTLGPTTATSVSLEAELSGEHTHEE